ncbi:MAG: S1 RNA-binding domain-containing protein [Elusimicrobia bacterium]|nr:S1 RNA-binding domain-containing protein [Elusimicrobiota bacterium]
MNDMEEKNAKPEEQTGQEQEMSMEQLLSQQGEVSEKLYSREIIQVKVVEVNSEYVFADIGEKKEAIIPVAEFDGKLPQPGEEVMAVLEKRGDENRNAVLSHRKAKEKISWQWLEKAFAAKERIKGKILEQVKGGYIVDVSGLRGFMPLSLSELGGSPKHYLPVNAKIKFYVTDMDAKNRKIIVSRRQVLEEDEKIRRQEVMGQTKEGQVTRVVVSKIIDTGLFVRYQGMEGFVNLSDVAWKDPQEALKSYKRGQRIKVKILKADKENQKLVFGIKQTMPNPLDLLKRKFPFKTSLRVKVIGPAEGGLKVHVASDIYGFIPETDYGYDGVPQKDEEVNAVVVGVNPQSYELKLSMKRYQEMEDRKKVQQYLKGAPKLTLGQILTEADDNAGDQGEI